MPGSTSAGAAVAASTVAEALSSCGLPLPADLQRPIAAAAASGQIPAAGLPQQLRDLVSAAQLLAGRRPEGGGGGSSAATALLLASLDAVMVLLACDPAAAAALLVSHPQYLAMLAAAAAAPEPASVPGGPGSELEGRLLALAAGLQVDRGTACGLVLTNPVLLLVPTGPLLSKLRALANATGLREAQAAPMVTLYMFPQQAPQVPQQQSRAAPPQQQQAPKQQQQQPRPSAPARQGRPAAAPGGGAGAGRGARRGS